MNVDVERYSSSLYHPFKSLSVISYRIPDEDDSQPHVHPLYQTLLVVEGEYIIDINNTSHHCYPGELLTVPMGCPHRWKVKRLPTKILLIMHMPLDCKDFGELSAMFGTINSAIVKVKLPAEEFAAITAHIRQEISVHLRGGPAMTYALLIELFSLALRHLDGTADALSFVRNSSGYAISKALNYIEKHLHEAISIEALSAVACSSPSRFAHQFKKAVGKAPLQYVAELRIERAKNMLLFPEFSIAEIAAQLGFVSGYYFSRRFHQLTGESPIAFRKRGLRMGETPSGEATFTGGEEFQSHIGV
jgi:AraC-like DNA-binding protein/quercetin dioxygenase-like cupin family protein